MDARDGIEPSIVLLQRTVLPFDHPAIVGASALLRTMHPLASVPPDYCAGLFRLLIHNRANNIILYTDVNSKKIFLRVDKPPLIRYTVPAYEN